MRKLTLILLSSIVFSCNNADTAKETTLDSSSTTTAAAVAPVNYPYTIEHQDNWEIGSSDNTMAALNGLKAWEEGKMDQSIQYFGDSVRVQFDGMDKKMSKDSLKVFFTEAWNNYKTIKIKMYDWVSVISKDKSEEWVTLWYNQTWETKAGGMDSLSVINDFQLKNGKIIRLSEYARKLH